VVATAEVEHPQTDADDVAECVQAATWSVQEQGWKEVVPGLSEETIALLAPPVVVSAQPCDVGLTERHGYGR
jgi:hypothetical protein